MRHGSSVNTVTGCGLGN